MDALEAKIATCRICAPRFAATASAHSPRPVLWHGVQARILIAGQAPGMRVHLSGRPFTDRSGDRLRDWLGLSQAEFYDRHRVAILPMAFCFPGYDAKGADMPPPPVCAQTWRARVLAEHRDLALTLAIGGAAIRWHLNDRRPVAQVVADWRTALERRIIPLPHPSWRNTGWLKRHPWFAAELLPELRLRVRALMEMPG
ncbi:uracil-DNA glycosylase family protein [Gemmobacter serpentinus]|uniref:uracil-DNA glycosylase family protein n=1 Tax=Gemmobacter serpentinus TaxID=2652247 RepID=UPI00124D3B0A|nr:uracil-DNA glycosylase family protein [Gemmobacter serpentinus]